MVALQPPLLGSWAASPDDMASEELQPEECVIRLRKLIAEPPFRDWVPILDGLLREACTGLRELQGSTFGDNGADFPSSAWARHVLQLTLEYEEICEQSRDWRRRALLPRNHRLSGVVSAELSYNEGTAEQCQRDVEKLRRHFLADAREVSQTHSLGYWDERDEASLREEVIVSERCGTPREGQANAQLCDMQDTAARLSFAEQAFLHRAAAEERKAPPRRSKDEPRRKPVDLAMYDLSKGLASWMPSVLLSGQKWEAIWHTGVRVFGYEFWYGGDIVQAAPEVIPFGMPMKIVRLGTTQRRYKDLRRFIKDELASRYSKDGYDALQRNCNHFSHDVVRYLLDGQQIPAEVREQLDWYQNAALVQVLRPVLTRWLGSCADRGTIWPAAAEGERQTPSTAPTLLRSASFLGCCQYVTCPGSPGMEEGAVDSPYRPSSRGSVQARTRARPTSRERGGGEDLDPGAVKRISHMQSL